MQALIIFMTQTSTKNCTPTSTYYCLLAIFFGDGGALLTNRICGQTNSLMKRLTKCNNPTHSHAEFGLLYCSVNVTLRNCSSTSSFNGPNPLRSSQLPNLSFGPIRGEMQLLRFFLSTPHSMISTPLLSCLNSRLTQDNSVHMFWLFPQYLVITMGEIMFSVTGLEFSYSQVRSENKTQ